MANAKAGGENRRFRLPKAATGIEGFDEIAGGGLPRGRPSLVCGSAGSGKTLFAMEFLIKGALLYNEPGVFIAFEENEDELEQNVASLGFDVKSLIARKKLAMDHIHVERSEIEETGEYDLEALFVRLGHAIDSIGAKRVVLDTIEALFGAFSNALILRAELRRLFRWLKKRGVTAIITAERGEGSLTRHGMEEYISDCVILLDHRVNDQNAIRRLRVVKYRGTAHGTNEYPFIIDEDGFSVLPLTSLTLKHQATSQRISTGIPALDDMLEGKGFYRGSSILISGTAGTGKTTLAAAFVNQACRRGERVLYLAHEESASQIVRNMKSVGIDLQQWVDKGVLRVEATRPTQHSLETHLALTHKMISKFKPAVVIFDPVTNFLMMGSSAEVKALLMRLVDFLKTEQITALFTSLTDPGTAIEMTSVGLSSLIDAWILLRDVELNGERNRALNILKARGIAHSNQVREFLITDKGVSLVVPYLGAGGMLTGSARVAQSAQELASAAQIREDTERLKLALEQKQRLFEAAILKTRFEFQSEIDDLERTIRRNEALEGQRLDDEQTMAVSRKVAQDNVRHNSLDRNRRGRRS